MPRSAINAKDWRQRAGIMISLIKAGRTRGRAFFSCLEMGDGDQVVAEVYRRALTDEAIFRLYPHARTWAGTAAYETGKAAFHAGIGCASALDPDFLPLIRGLRVGESLPLLDAWIKGWTDANLAAPIPGWSAEENAALVAARGKGLTP